MQKSASASGFQTTGFGNYQETIRENEAIRANLRIVKDTPSLKLVVDFGVWCPRWIFSWIFRAIFHGKKAEQPTELFDQNRGQKRLNTNFYFSNFSGAAGIPQQNPGISHPKSSISLVSRGIPNFLAPTPSRGRPLPHRQKSELKSLGLGSFLEEANVQQLTCNIDLSSSCYYLFFSLFSLS